MNSIIDTARTLRAELEATAQNLAADTAYTPAGKAELYAKQAAATAKQLAALEEQHQAQREARAQELRRSIYSPPAADSSAFGTYREALDRAKAAASKDADALAELMNEAQLTGDEQQMHAAFVVAEQAQHDQVALGYVQARDGLADAYRELAALEHPDVLSTQGLLEAQAFSMPPAPRF